MSACVSHCPVTFLSLFQICHLRKTKLFTPSLFPLYHRGCAARELEGIRRTGHPRHRDSTTSSFDVPSNSFSLYCFTTFDPIRVIFLCPTCPNCHNLITPIVFIKLTASNPTNSLSFLLSW